MILTTGQILGRKYRVVSQIGEGGFGIVYLVDTPNGEFFALKTIQPELLGNKDAISRFHLECAIWSEMNHPNIVAVESVDELMGSLCLALEYIPPNSLNHNTLRHYIRFARPSLRQILHWSIQFCVGISHAYSKGLKCHRDIKPENILITPCGLLKITDFGVSRTFTDDKDLPVFGSHYTHHTYGIVGTFAYLSPEQLSDPELADQLSDVYAFGIVLYELISGGKRPFNAVSADVDSSGFLEEIYTLRREMRLDWVSSPVWPIVVKCLEFARSERFASFEEITSMLCHLLEEQYGETYSLPSELDWTIDELNQKSFCHQQLGNYDRMRFYAEKALDTAPQNPYASHCLGVTELGFENYEKARRLFNTALDFGLKKAEVYVNLGIANRQLGNIDEAILCYLEALAIDSSCTLAWYNIGICFLKTNRFDDALNALDMCVKTDPTFRNAWVCIADIFSEKGKHDLAAAAFSSALDLNRADPELLFRMGEALEKVGRFEEAKNSYEEIVGQNPAFPDAYFNLGLIYAREDASEATKEQFRLYLKTANPAETVKLSIARSYLD